jgi:thiamine biosynthesis protein ThiI
VGKPVKELLLIRYGELGLKGDNRASFERALHRHVEWTLRDMPHAWVSRSHGRLYVEGIFDKKIVLDRLEKAPGIVAINPALKVESDMKAIIEASVSASKEAVAKRGYSTFKVDAKRSDKRFPSTSPQINSEVGEAVLHAVDVLSVDVHSPDFTLVAEVRDTGTYVYWEEVRGPGGLPAGTSGKGLLLLSGGIDSPVAGYMGLKRGVRIDALHFWSYPIVGQRSRDKVVDLARILANSGPDLKLYIAHFTDIQSEILQKCPERFRVIVMRRMMMRVACEWASRTGAQAVFTGENIGQVASQTLESLRAIEDVATLPVLRPLICFNKVETIEIARSIGTYDISCQPYEDCCTVFVPRHPVTKPRLEDVRAAEKYLDVQELVDACVSRME